MEQANTTERLCHGTLKSSEMKGLYVKEFKEELIKIKSLNRLLAYYVD